MFELVSPGAHLWSLDVDGWRIPCRTELGCCSSGMSIESALKNVDARCQTAETASLEDGKLKDHNDSKTENNPLFYQKRKQRFLQDLRQFHIIRR